MRVGSRCLLSTPGSDVGPSLSQLQRGRTELPARSGGSEAHAVIQRSRQSRHALKEQAPADQAAAVAPPVRAGSRDALPPNVCRREVVAEEERWPLRARLAS